MNTTKFAFMALLGLAVTTTACKKEDDADTTKPVVSVTMVSTGNSNGEYHDGATIEFTVEASDETGLHGVETTITREHDGVVVFEDHDHDVDKAYIFDVVFTLDNGGSHTNFIIKAVAIDDSDNEAESSVTIHSHPM